MVEKVEDQRDRSRYVIEVDGEVGGFVLYGRRGNELTLVHTETDPRFRGHGLGGHLIAAVLAEAREQGLAVLPECPFARRYIAEHPEYTDLVPAGQRARFGL